MPGILDYNWNPLTENSNTLLALAGGFLSGQPGAGFANASRVGLAEDEMAQKRRELMNTQSALYQAGLGSGLSPQMATAFARSPEAATALAPKFAQIGQNIFQQPQYGFVNPLTQKIAPAPMPGGGTSSAPGSNLQLDENKPLYPQLPKGQQSVVDSMIAGRTPLPSAFALKTPYWNVLLQAANEKEAEQGRTFDASVWAQRNDTSKQFSATGKAGLTIGALDTVQGHIAKASDAVERLKGTDWSLINSAYNALSRNTPIDKEQRDALNTWNNTRTAVEDEMAKAYKGGQMSDSEIKRWNELLGEAKSPNDLRRALKDFTELLNTKRQQLLNQHEAIMGRPYTAHNAKQNEEVTRLVEERFNKATGRTPQVGSPAPSPFSREAIEAEMKRRKLLQQ